MSLATRNRERKKETQVVLGAERKSRTHGRVVKRGWFDGAYSAILKDAEEFASKQLPDAFAQNYLTSSSDSTSAFLNPLSPPYNPELLERVVNINNTLPQCVAAMVTNCELTGHTLHFMGDTKKKKSPEAEQERMYAENFLRTPNGVDSIRNVRRKLRTDLETVGYWFMEVGRNKKGDIRWFDHLPAKSTRICPLELTLVPVKRWVMRENGFEQITVKQRFRRYVQLIGGKKVFFKEYGDPRIIDPKTGKEDAALKFSDSASEVIHHCVYPVDGYGVPRWSNNIPAALGSRECELVNLQFFKDNTIPAMAILVSGGYLTQDTIDDLQANFGASQGRSSMNRVLIIEARPDEEAVGDVKSSPPIPTLHMEPLGASRQSDELFTGYDKSNQEKLRSSFRLPPIFIGHSLDYTYATAQASIEVTERQVFGPEKQDFDDIINTKILLRDGKPMQFYAFRSNVSKVTDVSTIMQVMTLLMQFGGGTANLCIQMAKEVCDMNIPFIEEPWGDAPWALIAPLVQSNALEVTAATESALSSISKAMDKYRKTGKDSQPFGSSLNPDNPGAPLPPPVNRGAQNPPQKSEDRNIRMRQKMKKSARVIRERHRSE